MPEERVFNLTVEEGGKRVDTYVADALCALLEDEKADDRAGDFGFGDDDDLEDQEEFELSGDAAAGTAYNAYAYRTFSRSSVKKLIDGGNVTVNGKSCKANLKLKTGDNVTVTVPEPEKIDAEPENIPLDVVYEDGDIIVVNKPRGMVVHPAAGNTSGTLVNALLYRCTDLSDINGEIRPGIVHRIDKDTTGLICVAKNNAAHLALAAQLKDHSMARVYYTVTEGRPKVQAGTVNMTVGRSRNDRKKMAAGVPGGREAVTHFEVIEEQAGFALLRVKLETGRTHQIRVHLAAIGYPVAGDPVYGIKNTRGLAGQLLHAGRLTLTHPSTGEVMTFKAPLPDDFKAFLRKNRFETENPEETL